MSDLGMKMIMGPAISAALVFGYEYFQNKYSPMMDHVKVAALAAAASGASGMLFKSLPLPEMVEMVAQPGVSGVAFALGRKQFLHSRNTLMMDVIEGAGSDLVGFHVGRAFS
jgi:hypothetical protein